MQINVNGYGPGFTVARNPSYTPGTSPAPASMKGGERASIRGVLIISKPVFESATTSTVVSDREITATSDLSDLEGMFGFEWDASDSADEESAEESKLSSSPSGVWQTVYGENT